MRRLDESPTSVFAEARLRFEPFRLAYHKLRAPRSSVPLRVLFGLLFLVLLTVLIWLPILAIQRYEQASRSHYVQGHGDRRVATVVKVDNIYQGKGNYTAQVTVTLRNPVAGDFSSIVYYPDKSRLVKGQKVVVVVDPKASQYSEIPGHPYTGQYGWIIIAIIPAADLMVLGFIAGKQLFKIIRLGIYISKSEGAGAEA